jgi:hypothetical protein
MYRSFEAIVRPNSQWFAAAITYIWARVGSVIGAHRIERTNERPAARRHYDNWRAADLWAVSTIHADGLGRGLKVPNTVHAHLGFDAPVSRCQETLPLTFDGILISGMSCETFSSQSFVGQEI